MTTTLKPERRNQNKTALRPFEIKAVEAKDRTFEGLAAAYTLDLGGDIIAPGAFTKTLAYWREKGFSIPLLNQHNYYNGIHDVLGSMVDAEERTEGLWAKFEVSQGANGDLLLDHITNKRLNGLSIGYQPVEYEINSDTGIRTLKEIRLKEVSAVIWPMNEDAIIDANSIKSLLLTKAKPKYAVGDRIIATASHMEGMKGMAGEVDEARAGSPPYYAINFDEPMGEGNPHKWLAEDEMKAEKPGHKPSMDMGKSVFSDLTEYELKESLEALTAEATARAEKANPMLTKEKADQLRNGILALRLRPLLSRTSGQNSAHLTPNEGKANESPTQEVARTV